MAKKKVVSREILFQPAACLSVQIDPTGKRLLYAGASVDGAVNLYLCENLTLEQPKPLTTYTDAEIKEFYWACRGDKILYLRDDRGKGHFQINCIDLKNGSQSALTPHIQSAHIKVFKLNEDSDKAALGIKQLGSLFHDVYLIDLNTYSLSLLLKNEQFTHFVFDDALNIAAKVRLHEDNSFTVIGEKNQPLFTIPAEDAYHSELLDYSTNEQALYLLDSRGRDTTALKKFRSNQQETAIAADSKSDIHEVLFENGKPVAYATYDQTKKWHTLEQSERKHLDLLSNKLGSNFSIASSRANSRVVENMLPRSGREFWLYSKQDQSLHRLFSPSSSEEASNMYPFEIFSRDGMRLVCYLTLPNDHDIEGRPDQPLPMVVIPHGGPFKVRDYLQHSPFHQWLASRGYAVLSVNFRSSCGFGKAFANAGNGQWGKKSHLDVIDAVNWCIKQKIALPEKIAIFGKSYGGFEALASLVFSPETFTCAVAICGPSSLMTVLKNVPLFWEFNTTPFSSHKKVYTKYGFFRNMGGDPNTADGRAYLESCSPLNFVDNIQKPLLLVHGMNDPIVAASESQQIFDVMAAKNLQVRLATFSDEGHGIFKFANMMCYLYLSELLLAKHLGGEVEPLDEKWLEKSSLQFYEKVSSQMDA